MLEQCVPCMKVETIAVVYKESRTTQHVLTTSLRHGQNNFAAHFSQL